MAHRLHSSGVFTPDTEFATKLRDLSRLCAFPTPVDSVVVHQTHISAVFVGGDLALKVKKPVKLPFLDFSSIQRRRFYCEEEVRINRSWAPGVYLGVIPVTQDADGAKFQGLGDVTDWAVKMRRLSDADNLKSRLQAGTLTRCQLIHVAHRIASLHQNACRYPGDQATEADEEFRRRIHENWGFARGLPTEFIDPHVLKRLETLSNEWLRRFDEELRRRAQSGMIREVHGDLRLEHVFLCPDRTPPWDVLVIDGIEFYPGLRRVDVVSDLAFLVMELQFAGYRELAREFSDAYFSETEDTTGRDLLPLYAAYRSAVRGKVAAILSGETEIAPEARAKARSRSRAHWLWSLSELEQPDRRPALILVSGLPGTGKSTLARGLAEITSIDEVLRTDVVRRELQAASPVASDALYLPQEIIRVYDECSNRAQDRLWMGERVIVDATFQSDTQRESFLQLAIDCGVRCLWLECIAPAEACRQRLDARTGDASDANWNVYQTILTQWEPASAFTERFHAVVNASGSTAATLDAAREVLPRAQPDHIIREHALAHGIMPVQIDALGLSSALQELATSTDSQSGVTCHFESSRDVFVPSNLMATHLFRIAQEAVTNALRQGQADRIDIRLLRNANQVELEISDNGRGFDLSETRLRHDNDRNSHWGLRIMEYRAGLADKILAIVSPILAFVAIGWEHSIANWFFLPPGSHWANPGQIPMPAI